MKKIIAFALVLLLSAPLASCGGRVPSAHTAHSMTAGFFKKYGKKYKDSLFGRIPVNKVEIYRIKEQSRHLAEVEAFVNFSDGEMARVLVTTKKKPPFGWYVISWEMVEVR